MMTNQQIVIPLLTYLQILFEDNCFYVMMIMMSTTLFLLAATVLAVDAAPFLLKAPVASVIRDQYIIRFKENESFENFRSRIHEIADEIGGFDLQVGHIFDNLAAHGLAGFSARLSKIGIAILMRHDLIESIEEDQLRHAYGCKSQTEKVDWGLARVSQANFTSSRTGYEYRFSEGSNGADVDAYVLARKTTL